MSNCMNSSKIDSLVGSRKHSGLVEIFPNLVIPADNSSEEENRIHSWLKSEKDAKFSKVAFFTSNAKINFFNF